jgi:hypothetical protein
LVFLPTYSVGRKRANKETNYLKPVKVPGCHEFEISCRQDLAWQTNPTLEDPMINELAFEFG